MLSPPSQSCADTWQWKITFYFKAQTFIIFKLWITLENHIYHFLLTPKNNNPLPWHVKGIAKHCPYPLTLSLGNRKQWKSKKGKALIRSTTSHPLSFTHLPSLPTSFSSLSFFLLFLSTPSIRCQTHLISLLNISYFCHSFRFLFFT